MQINELGMREITEEEAADLGIDLSMAGVCKTLRKYFITLNIVERSHLTILRITYRICSHT